MTLITYKLTQENYQPQVGDEAEIWVEGEFYFVIVKDVLSSGHIVAKDAKQHKLFVFDDCGLFYDVIGDV